MSVGREAEATAALEALDAPPKPSPGRLAWPVGDSERLHQAWLIRSQLAERAQDWPLMARCLDEALALQPDDVVSAARRTWAKDRQLHQEALADEERSQLEREVSGELNELSSLGLLGEAMFYRSLVAAQRLPDRAQRDWQALIRQRRWAEAQGQAAEARLLWIGDRLREAGELEEAARAYQRAAGLGGEGAGQRLAAMPIWRLLAGDDGELVGACLEAGAQEPDNAIWPLLGALGVLQAEPPDAQQALELLAEARERGLEAPAADLMEALCRLIQGAPGASEAVAGMLAEAELPGLAPTVRGGLRLLAGPEPWATRLESFREAWGTEWPRLCPVDPALLVEFALLELERDNKLAAAVELAAIVRREGCQLPALTVARLLGRCALSLATQGRFDQAREHVARAEQLLEASDSGSENT